MRTVVVGLGIGWRWVREVLKREEQFELVGIVDIVKDKVDNMRNALGLPENVCFVDFEEALREAKPELCIIATPPNTHKGLIEKAVEAGADVICEKPLAYNLEEAVEAVDIASRAGARLVVNQNYRFASIARNTKKVLESGAIGKVGYANVEFYKRGDRDQKNYRLTVAHALLLEMGVHHFDLMRYFLGEIEGICAYEFRPKWSWFEGESAICANILVDGGVGVSYIGSLVSTGKETLWEGNWRMEGEKGAIAFGIFEDEPGVFLWKEEEGEKLPVDATPQGAESFGAVLDEFLRTGKLGEKMPNEGEDNLKTLAVSFAAIRSWQERRWVSPQEVLAEIRR